jgi:hypothetical protein
MRSSLVASAAIILWAASSASAQTPTAGNDARTYDPNEKVCESVKVTGSRLGVRRVCATRAEWAQRRLDDRRAVEQAQTGHCVYQGSGTSGRPACNH